MIFTPHPFMRLFEDALYKSTKDENVLLERAEYLRDAGYDPQEVRDVLLRFKGTLLIKEDSEIVKDALDVFSEDLSD
jgi:hypothetical protein